MGSKIRALAWEECRVGGVIAVACTTMGLVLMLMYRWITGSSVWTSSEEILTLGVLGTPFMTALLLVLNPDYTGELVGGFSKRVMRLPVPTWAAVLVALTLRAGLVLATTAVMIEACGILLQEGPGFEWVFLAVAAYLLIQTLDWLRAPISGLSSALLLLTAFVALQFVRGGGGRAHVTLVETPTSLFSMLVLTGLIAVAAYGVSVVAVGAARVGRRVGVPEIWEWPQRLSMAWPARSAAFRSPVTAQVWLELRRFAWIVPSITFGVWLIALLVIRTQRGGDLHSEWKMAAAAIPFGTFLIAAAIHGARTGIVGFRSLGGNAGFLYLQPLSNADHARARILTNLIIFVPTLVAIVVIHFALAGRVFLVEVVSYNVGTGAASLREVIWILATRGVFVGLIAWALLGVGTKSIRKSIALAFAVSILVLAVTDRGVVWTRHFEYSLILSVYTGFLCLLVCMLAAYARTWGKNLIARRTLLFWTGSWLLGAWIIFHAVPMRTFHGQLPALGVVTGVVLSVAFAALIPFPYAAFLLDVCRRRHSAMPLQEQSELTEAASRTGYVFAGCAAVFAIWLGWPGTPGYEAVWRSKGYPATLAELNAWYPDVPDNQNAAVKYTQIASEVERLDREFLAGQTNGLEGVTLDTSADRYVFDRVMIVGTSHVDALGPIPEDTVRVTEAYWQEVTSRIVPSLQQVGREEASTARYPIDLEQGFNVQLEHLARLRNLARELSVDALHWSMAGEASKATDSIQAQLALADSLSEEPLLISQLVRIAILGIAGKAAEFVTYLAPMSDAELLQLRQTLGQALPPVEQGRILDRAIMGEAAIGLSIVNLPLSGGWPDPDHQYIPLYDRGFFQPIWMFPQMVFPAEGERMSMIRFYDEAIKAGADLRMSMESGSVRAWDDRVLEAMQFMSPRAATLLPAIGRAYEAEYRIRMQLAMAQTGLSIRRYRLATGHLPDNLELLVPDYVAQIPVDIYTRELKPVSYRKLDNGGCIVYSFGMNRADNEGKERNGEDDSKADDFAFTVGPVAQ